MDSTAGSTWRTAAVKAAACIALCAAIVAAGVLAGCESENRKTASAIPVDAAMADSYTAALAAVQERAADAKLVAVRSSGFASADAAARWMYLFVSASRVSAYTVFSIGGDATVADYDEISFTEEQFAAIPDASEASVDADKAYDAAVRQIDGECAVATCRTSLLLATLDDADAVGDTMMWVFDFNNPDDIAARQDSLANDDSLQEENAYDEFVVWVDARDGSATLR